ncbi:hypothetical protein BJY01DRAFT_255347 [Aspergillus pseudoustus]|uniref:Transcription factor domain-containing protein n=1 Tax=Aspergillus pseudoustus TaxID=1810923 RepID=A0ABR4ILB2_9EURO
MPLGTTPFASLIPTAAWMSRNGSAGIGILERTTPVEDTPRPVSGSDENELPSIYTTSVVDTLNDSYSHRRSETPRTRQRFHGATVRDVSFSKSTIDRQDAATTRHRVLPSRDILDMFAMFREKLLPLIPALDPNDPLFADDLIETSPMVATCICYVTAKFLPGGRELRRALMPEIRDMLGMGESNGLLEDLPYMKILLVLFAHSKFNSPSSQSSLAADDDILYWPLKAIIEMKALRLSMHGSLRDLKRTMSIDNSWPVVSASTAYIKYLISLQLFVMAHYSSVITGTPPTIRIDSSIRAASTLGLKTNRQVERLIGEVELCILWKNASSHHPSIGEWWCPPDATEGVDSESIELVLLNADQEVDTWYRKWKTYIDYGDRNATTLDYLGRYTRFCISSYAIGSLRGLAGNLSATQQLQVHRCAAYASRVLDWSLELRPAQRHRLRFTPDSAVAMMSFCCLFLMATVRTFPSAVESLSLCLERVRLFAELLLDIAPQRDRLAHIYGSLIAERANALHSVNSCHQATDPAIRDVENAPFLSSQSLNCFNEPPLMPGQLNVIYPGESNTELFWDFSQFIDEPYG